MPNIHRKLITIVTEAALENELLEALNALGASGYTITNARGKGSRGVRDAGWTSSSNIRVEVICSERLAQTISDYMREHYYRNYAMILYESEVLVMREEKFS